MISKSELKAAFGVYFDEIERCKKGACYWALLHLIIVLPDVCAAMETPNGDNGNYEKWCKRYLADPIIKPPDWYRIRCIILHQGRTRDDAGKSQYAGFNFGQPTGNGSYKHRCVEKTAAGKLLHLDVGQMSNDILEAINKWFAELVVEPSSSRTMNVAHNLPCLARPQLQRGLPHPLPIGNFFYMVTSSPQQS